MLYKYLYYMMLTTIDFYMFKAIYANNSDTILLFIIILWHTFCYWVTFTQTKVKRCMGSVIDKANIFFINAVMSFVPAWKLTSSFLIFQIVTIEHILLAVLQCLGLLAKVQLYLVRFTSQRAFESTSSFNGAD